MEESKLELIIFDMDGTLLDSMECLADWIHRAIKDHCPADVTPATVTKAFGPTESAIIEHFVGPELLSRCLDGYYKLYEEEHGRVYVYPGITELLQDLKARGIPLALCTGKSRRAVEISLKQLGWASLFQEIVTGDDTRKFKPDPEGINIILSRIKAARERTLFVGDSPVDVTAAASAGVISGRAEWGVPAGTGSLSQRPTHALLRPQAIMEIL